MALIIDKNSIQKNYQPMLGEIVRMGAREGIYVGRTKNVHQVLVQWREMAAASVVPSSFLNFTGELDGAFVERCYAIDSPGHKGKGGLKTGGRRIKRTRADIAFKRQEIRQKKLAKGSGPGNAVEEDKKFKNEMEKNFEGYKVGKEGKGQIEYHKDPKSGDYSKRKIRTSSGDTWDLPDESITVHTPSLKKPSPGKEAHSVQKHSHMTGSDKTPCLGCNKLIAVNDDSMEPFYCKPCQKRLGFIHITEEFK